MARIDEEVSERFYRWERRGRGWDIYEEPIHPEPPFVPFPGHLPSSSAIIDDGRRPTRLSAWAQRITSRMGSTDSGDMDEPKEKEEPEAVSLMREPSVEFPIYLSAASNPKREAFGQFLASLSLAAEPIAFEVIGTSSQIVVQLAANPDDVRLIRGQVRAFFPDASTLATSGELERAWDSGEAPEMVVLEFGLNEPFMRTLALSKADTLIALVGALEGLAESEVGIYQVIFAPAKEEWSESIRRSTTDPAGKGIFVNMPDLVDEARRKIESHLYAVVVRIAVRASDYLRVCEIASHLAGSLKELARQDGNELVPLHNDNYPQEDHIHDLLFRQTRRSGMILNRDELLGFVHLPTAEVRSLRLIRQMKKTKAAPKAACQPGGLLLGENVHLGEEQKVALSADQRVRHTHIIGASGTGKSTLLFNLIRQDIEKGEGLAVLDPHGDLIDQILGAIPSHRENDVIVFDPSDGEYPIGFNILSAQSDLEKTLLASDLVSVFERLSTSWGDQMGSVLSNAILAFLESSDGGTLADIRRFLIDSGYREQHLATVQDPDNVLYWRKVFPQLTGGKSIGPILTRLDEFLRPKPIRAMVSQKRNRLDFPAILDGGKIFLAKLSQGAIGNENAYLLGSVLMAKFQQTAMSRQRQSAAARRDFWIYLDEFHNFITPSLAEILSGARKYRIGLVLAHQELKHLDRDKEVGSAVLSNSGNRICFRLGDQDARALESGFSFFEARDLQNLDKGEAICRVERSDFDFNLSVPWPAMPSEDDATATKDRIIALSRAAYGTPVEKSAQPPVQEAPNLIPPSKPEAALVASVLQPEKRLIRDLGRGGEQHKAIQLRIKEAAEGMGFRVHVEKLILDDAGCVDLVLDRGSVEIACEISVTTTVDHEFGNVAKCIRAGFNQIAVVAVDADKLERIKAAVGNSLGPETSPRVGYFLPDALIAYLQKIECPPAPSSVERRTRGYRVRKNFVAISIQEAKAREGALIKTVADSLKRPKASLG